MHLKTLLTALLALALLVPASANAYTPRHGKPCRKGYSKRFKAVRHHGHKHQVRICVKRKAKVAAPASPPKATKLHAHLDPSYTRDPLDPFKVTYAYSASATQEVVSGASASMATISSAEEPAPLPSGVLALYSDGKLECAINVGGSVTGNECPVSYKALGEHTVTTIYSSGEQSATETEVEIIEPLATTTTLSVSYEPYVRTRDTFGCGPESTCLIEEGWHGNGGFQIGELRVTGGSSPVGDVPVSACPQGDESCKPLDDLGPEGEARFPVSVIANWTSSEERVIEVGETINLGTEEIKHISIGGLVSEATLPQIESGAFYFRVTSPSPSGYSASTATAPIQFTPAVVNPVERVEG